MPDKANVDDDVADGKVAAVADHIVSVLGASDIVALQEVQDNDGGEYSAITAADQTLKALTDAIMTAGGPDYRGISCDSIDDAEGGQHGGNIRVAFLFNPDRVAVETASVQRIGDPSIARTRLPLAVTFRFQGNEVLAINVHFSSKGGSDPL